MLRAAPIAEPVSIENYSPFASLSRRLVAFLIDIIPITAAVFFAFYFSTDFRETVDRYLESPRDLAIRKQFLEERNKIRDLSGLIYLVYAGVFEGSAWQGTIGKRLLRLRVTGLDGRRVSPRRAFTRNISKMLSIVPAFVGCLAAFWNDQRQTWHDRLAKTLVLRAELPASSQNPFRS